MKVFKLKDDNGDGTIFTAIIAAETAEQLQEITGGSEDSDVNRLWKRGHIPEIEEMPDLNYGGISAKVIEVYHKPYFTYD